MAQATIFKCDGCGSSAITGNDEELKRWHNLGLRHITKDSDTFHHVDMCGTCGERYVKVITELLPFLFNPAFSQGNREGGLN